MRRARLLECVRDVSAYRLEDNFAEDVSKLFWIELADKCARFATTQAAGSEGGCEDDSTGGSSMRSASGTVRNWFSDRSMILPR